MIGNSVLTLFTKKAEGEQSANTLVITFALMAMCCLGIRVVVSKFCTQIISTSHYIELNFIVEFALGFILFSLYCFGAIEMHFETTRILILAAASTLSIFAEFFLFLGIEIGVVGVVVAVVASNFVLVAIFS